MEHLLQATNLAPPPEQAQDFPVTSEDPIPDPDTPRTRTRTRQSSAARPPGPWTKERRARWTKDEDDELIALVRVSPPLTWGQIAEGISTERASAGCMMRWYNHVRKVAGDVARVEPAGSVVPDHNSASPDPSTTTLATTSHPRRWTPADDTVLLAAVAQHGRKWDAVASSLASGEGRSVRAYRERWQKIVKAQGEDEDRSDEEDDEDADGSEDEGVDLEAVLNAAPPPGEQFIALTMNWSPQDDAQLIDGVSADPPLTWYQIGERMNPPRLGAECLKRWYHSGKALAPHVIRVEPLPGQLAPTPARAPAQNLYTPYPMPHIPSLPSTALVSNPPIPFQANSVIRGRRTLSPSALAGTLFSPKGRQRKVHCCPADNCGAAFKRSEHLKRHYRAVHVGAKPFPCQWSSCGKSFSRKDNLQQHMSMVHGSPVPGSSAGTPNLKTKPASRAVPKLPKEPIHQQSHRDGSSSGSSSEEEDSLEREDGPSGIRSEERGEPVRKRNRTESVLGLVRKEEESEEDKVEAEESYERTRC